MELDNARRRATGCLKIPATGPPSNNDPGLHRTRTAQDIADRLNAEGWKPPKRPVFNAPMIRRLLQRRGLGTRRPIWSGNVPCASDDEITIQELAEHLGAHRQTVYGWLRRGTLKGRLVQVGTQRTWLVSRAQAASRTSSRESS